MCKASLRRTHRQVIYLNDKELAAVKEYCDRFGVKERSTIFREAAMERILAQLDDSHPTFLTPCTPFQGDKRPSGRSAEAALSLRSGSSDERLCTNLQTRTSCRHIHKSQSLEWRRLPRFRHTIGTAATILCFL